MNILYRTFGHEEQEAVEAIEYTQATLPEFRMLAGLTSSERMFWVLK